MTPKDRQALARAIRNHETITVTYAKPAEGKGAGGGRLVTRHVRPYELSVNRKGRPVLWGTDSQHGPRQIHAFRNDRIVAVKESQRPTRFQPAASITRHLNTYDPED